MAGIETGTRVLIQDTGVRPRRMITRPKNPMDKATIVSIYPQDIFETKPTLIPCSLLIPKGSFDSPSLTIVEPASFYEEVGPNENDPLREVPTPATMMADSYISDWCKGLLGYEPGVASPGLFYIPGIVSPLDLKIRYKNELAEANQKQKKWFEIIVNIADSLWARSNGNPLVIWDIQRLAARELGLEAKPWLKASMAVEMVRCKACGSLKDPNFPVCGNCKAIDNNHPNAKDLTFAK